MNFIKNKVGDAANAAKNAVQAARSNNNINATGSALQQIRNTIDNLSAANGNGGLRMEGDKIFYFSVDEESMAQFYTFTAVPFGDERFGVGPRRGYAIHPALGGGELGPEVARVELQRNMTSFVITEHGAVVAGVFFKENILSFLSRLVSSTTLCTKQDVLVIRRGRRNDVALQRCLELGLNAFPKFTAEFVADGLEGIKVISSDEQPFVALKDGQGGVILNIDRVSTIEFDIQHTALAERLAFCIAVANVAYPKSRSFDVRVKVTAGLFVVAVIAWLFAKFC